ncbi:MAG: UDP-N-acetylmuramoyl-tripeptide--D-alanyl-D-alanine ligase [bacterium]|nr:UDP-N-acetylmuramoyl-tripeptide--D-alanyl-D-alanine ligase [bacterium]
MIALQLGKIAEVVSGKLRGNHAASATGVSTDTRTLNPGDLYIALRGERFDGHTFVGQAFDKGACAAVVSEQAETADEHKGPFIVVADPRDALFRLAQWYRQQLTCTVIAVTGSNGKTTTKCMIDHLLGTALRGRAARKSYNNDIGVPLTLLSGEVADEYLVVEIGSNAPGEVARLARLANPEIGVVTSIGEAHLAGLGSIEDVAREKLSLLDHVKPDGTGVVNLDDVRSVDGASIPSGQRTVTFGIAPDADVSIGRVESTLKGVGFRIGDRRTVTLPVLGVHNALNAAAAYAVGRCLGLAEQELVEALSTVRLPEMRLKVHRIGGVTLIEDCYNANPTSMAAGVEVLQSVGQGRRVLVAGEMLELGSGSGARHYGVGALAGRRGVEVIVSVGRGAVPVVEGACAESTDVLTLTCKTTEEACARVPDLLRAGDTVLLKGSRALGLERVTRSVASRFGATDRVSQCEQE